MRFFDRQRQGTGGSRFAPDLKPKQYSSLVGSARWRSLPRIVRTAMAKTAMSQLEHQVELIRREAFAAGYAAAMPAVHEIASRQPQPAPRRAQARRARADSKPSAKRLERGSNAKFVEEALRARAPQAVRPAEIRAALQRDKGVSLAFTSIRHALGQLEARNAVEQDGNGGWRIV